MQPVIASKYLVPAEEGRRPEDATLDGLAGRALESPFGLTSRSALQDLLRVATDPARHLPDRLILANLLKALWSPTLLLIEYERLPCERFEVPHSS